MWRIRSFIDKYSRIQEPKTLNVLKIEDSLEDETDIAKNTCLAAALRVCHLMIDLPDCFQNFHLIFLQYMIAKCKSRSYLKRLTLNYDEHLPSNYEDFPVRKNINKLQEWLDSHCDTVINIDTLRLFSKNLPWKNLLTDEKVVERMNFDKNLKHLTIEIELNIYDDEPLDDIENVVTNIIKKDHLFNLQIGYSYRKEDIDQQDKYSDPDEEDFELDKVNEVTDILFDILHANVNLLKHQFKQLNFGMCRCFIHYKNPNHMVLTDRYKAFSWNSNIDTNFINNQKTQWKLLVNSKEIIKRDSMAREMYTSFQEQWDD